jgi:hypothetical protein
MRDLPISWSRRATLILGLAVCTTASMAQETAQKVSGAYTISLAGIKIGDFYFQSKLQGTRYAVHGDARISALLGSVSWKGKANSEGVVSGRVLLPAAYRMKYRASRKKSGDLKISFADGVVSRIEMQPPSNPAPDLVPVRAHHLKGAYDPLSAMMALASGYTTNPCARRVSVFDGKFRFDLALSFHRRASIRGLRGEQTSVATVCRVRFIPVAGYRDDKNMRKMAAAQGMEVWMRGVPEADLMVPHEVRVPTFAGQVVLHARRVDIVSRNNRQIALVN